MFEFPLFLAAVTLPTGVVLGGLAGLAGLGGFIAFNVGQKREQLKRELMQLSETAAMEGLPLTGGILEDIVVDDLSGLIVHVRALLSRLRNPDTRREIVMPFLKTQLTKWSKGEGGRDPNQLKAFIEETLGVTVTLTPKAPKE